MSVFNVRLVGFMMMVSLAVLLPVAMISGAAIEPVRDQVTTIVPLSHDLKQETTQPPTKDDTEIEPMKCICNLPECVHTSRVCSTKLGCFKELRIDLLFTEDAAGQKRFDQNGVSGCMEMSPMEKSCKDMLDSVEHLNTEFPPMQIQSISKNAIYMYHCCQNDMCNSETQVASILQAVHEKLVAAYKRTMPVQVKENNVATTNITVEQTTVPDGDTNVNSTEALFVYLSDFKIEKSTASTTDNSTASTTDNSTASTTDNSTASTTDNSTASTTDNSTAFTTDNSTTSTTDNSTASTTVNGTAEAVESVTDSPDVITVIIDLTTKVPEELTTRKIVENSISNQTRKGVNPTDEGPENKPEVLNELDVSQKEQMTTTAIPELPLVSSTQGEKEVM